MFCDRKLVGRILLFSEHKSTISTVGFGQLIISIFSRPLFNGRPTFSFGTIHPPLCLLGIGFETTTNRNKIKLNKKTRLRSSTTSFLFIPFPNKVSSIHNNNTHTMNPPTTTTTRRRASANSSATSNHTDANQKRRRPKRSKWWKRWSAQHPLQANLLVVFVSLCLLCMMAEYLGGQNNHNSHDGGQRMKRYRALLQRTQPQQASNSGDDRSGSVSRNEQQQEEEEFHNKRRGRHNRQQDHDSTNNNNNNNKHKRRGHNRQQDHNSKEEEDDDNDNHTKKRYKSKDIASLLTQMNQDIVHNRNGGVRWIAPYLMLPPTTAGSSRQLQSNNMNDDQEMTRGRHKRDAVNPRDVDVKSEYFKVKRQREPNMAWEGDYDRMAPQQLKPPVDYTTHAYQYPPLQWEVPDVSDPHDYAEYPPLRPLGEIMTDWPQDDDYPHAAERPIPETLLHFNYTDPQQLEAARKFRDAELPFKLYNVPEVSAATLKWTDEYVTEQFDGGSGGGGYFFRGGGGRRRQANNGNLMERMFGKNPRDETQSEEEEYTSPPPQASGVCQESPNNFFAFFQPALWDVNSMGLPPVRTNDWTFEHWARHAQYADGTALDAGKPHFYWQSGIPKEERLQPKSKWTFVSRDLPSLSSPTETFFVFEPESQKGIQCRFGERGVVAATHYDSGRNMIAMVTGAKRYILAPPKECASLGIVPWKLNAVFRHSLLNFGHINYMNQTPPESSPEGNTDGDDHQKHPNNNNNNRQWTGDHMSQVEREWMEIAGSSKAIETVLKAGEVLYIPSHWFHYIVSLQKSAQCNVRSGVDDQGSPSFGGTMDVKTCGRLKPEEVREKRH